MRQVQVLVTCDPCQAWHGAENLEGVQTVSVAGGQTLDLCPDHRRDLAPFLALVAEWGATPSSNGGSRKRASAPVVEQEAPTAARNRRGGKRARARRNNGAERPSDVVVTGTPTTLACPMGCGSELGTSASLGAHLRQTHSTTIGAVYGTACPLCGHDASGSRHLVAHGVTGGMPVAFAVAQQQGDPVGVVAARALAVSRQ